RGEAAVELDAADAQGRGALRLVSSAPEHHQSTLVLEQPALAIQPPAEAGERPVRSDDAMAGDDDGDRIFPVGGAHSAGEAHVAQAARHVAIAPRGPVRDGAEDIPHAPLKRRAGRVQGDVEGRGGPAEVLRELLAGSGEKTTRR